MKQTGKAKRNTVLTALAAVSALVLAVWQSLLLQSKFDFDTHTYDPGTASPMLMLAVLAVFVLFFLSTLVWKKEKTEETLSRGGVLLSVSASLCGAALLVSCGLFFHTMLFSGLPYAGNPDRAQYALKLASALLAIPSAVYFFRIAFSRQKLSRPAVMLSFAPVAYTAVFLVGVYYDRSIRLNSPVRILDQLALIALMLALLYESRFQMERPNARLYKAFAWSALPLLGVSAIPHAVMMAGGSYAMDASGAGYAFAAFCALYLAVRLFSLSDSEQEEVSIEQTEADAVETEADAGEKDNEQN
ncbi:MAG: hypothetical protein E7655_07260 [Ruminococcaceae bacterium]|nr:hypothetical protein [Oscillospiraceae bacterium]